MANMKSFKEFEKDTIFTYEWSEMVTLKDTPRHSRTLCDGVTEGVYMVGCPERISEAGRDLNTSTIYSESLL